MSKVQPELCNICLEQYNKKITIDDIKYLTGNKIACIKCNYSTCTHCTKKYLLSSNNDAHCMSCKNPWDREFLMDNFTKVFVNKDYKNSISILDNLFEKLGQISGTGKLGNKLDDLYSLLDSDEIEENKISEVIPEIFILFDKEAQWRKNAAQNLMPELEKYNEVIKNNIGLRLQSRLTKKQAKFVASCNSIHRDISLNF